MKSNIAEWIALHKAGYFANHPRYQNRDKKVSYDLEYLGQFKFELRSWMNIVVIGAGYGRETAILAPLVKWVYAIDVSPSLGTGMKEFLWARKIENFDFVWAQSWHERIPSGIDLFYSIATFQHITKDLARDYLDGIADKLTEGTGRAVIQFAENETGTDDADLRIYEPNVKWSAPEIKEAVENAGLKLLNINTLRGRNKAGKEWTWHWVLIGDANGTE